MLATTLSYLLQQNKIDEALSYTKKFLKKYPDDLNALQLEGLTLYSKKDFKSAAKKFSMASQKSSSASKSVNLYLLAQAQLKVGEVAKAEATLAEMSKDPAATDYGRFAVNVLQEKEEIPEFKTSMLKRAPLANVNQANPKIGSGIPVKRFSLGSEFIYGVDSNPVFIPDNSETKNEAESTFYSVTLNGTFNSTLFNSEINHTLSTGYTGYQKEIAKVFNNFRWSFSSAWKSSQDFFTENQISFANKFDQSYGAQKKLEYFYSSDTLGMNKEFLPLGSHKFSANLSLGYRTYANKNLDSKENDRSGFTPSAGGVHKLAIDSWVWVNSLTYSKLLTV